MTSVAITVEGVLRRPNGGQPIPAGIDLYYALATRFKLVLLTEEKLDSLEWWLRGEGMNEHARIIDSDVAWQYDPSTWRRRFQVAQAHGMGHDVSLVIEPDPAVAASLIEDGTSVLLFCQAQYSLPSWRPDYREAPTPWDTLSARVEHEARLRAADKRVEES